MRAARGHARAGVMALLPARLAATIGTIGLLGAAILAALVGGCTQNCCTVDSYPIALGRAPLGAPPLGAPTYSDSSDSSDAGLPDGGALPQPTGGALVATAGLPNAPAGQTFDMVIDTGSPFTILDGPSGSTPQTNPAGWKLYGYGADVSPPPLRATFRGWSVIQVPLSPIRDATLLPPGGVLGADLLRNYSVELRFGALCPDGGGALCSSMTLWSHLGEDASLLEDAGYAVIGFTAFGGGEVTAEGNPDFLGLRGPLDVPATRVVMRSCVVPDPFSPTTGSPLLSLASCTNSQAAIAQASGVDLSLMIDTGVGPLVLSASAWARVVAAAAKSLPASIALPLAPAVEPSPAPPPLYVATWPTPIDVLLWATIPRFAFVNLETGANDDPGPCVELGRARRTEIVSYSTVHNPGADLCGAACDIDPNNTSEAQSSAAYLEIAGQIPVAVISDDEPFLQGLRFDILPEGPELDGLVGANALGRSRVELDYLSSPSRAVFSCETDAMRASCWAAARCPQLPDRSSPHYCFGLGPHGLPAKCAPPTDGGLPTTTTDVGAHGAIDGAIDGAMDGGTDGGPAALP
jgi:hypothetical protein